MKTISLEEQIQLERLLSGAIRLKFPNTKQELKFRENSRQEILKRHAALEPGSVITLVQSKKRYFKQPDGRWELLRPEMIQEEVEVNA